MTTHPDRKPDQVKVYTDWDLIPADMQEELASNGIYPDGEWKVTVSTSIMDEAEVAADIDRLADGGSPTATGDFGPTGRRRDG
jgi:hypothetical protein